MFVFAASLLILVLLGVLVLVAYDTLIRETGAHTSPTSWSMRRRVPGRHRLTTVL